jgi:hypothetical protein
VLCHNHAVAPEKTRVKSNNTKTKIDFNEFRRSIISNLKGKKWDYRRFKTLKNHAAIPQQAPLLQST